MNISARGAAVFSGAILGGFGVLGLGLDPLGTWDFEYLLASWLPPIVLVPGAALAAVLGSSPSDRFKDHTRVLWPVYVGLMLHGLGAGRWANYVAHIPMYILALQAVALLLTGGSLVPFATTRHAGFQIWLACLVLLLSWGAGNALV
jgi:hypothetical protein